MKIVKGSRKSGNIFLAVNNECVQKEGWSHSEIEQLSQYLSLKTPNTVDIPIELVMLKSDGGNFGFVRELKSLHQNGKSRSSYHKNSHEIVVGFNLDQTIEGQKKWLVTVSSFFKRFVSREYEISYPGQSFQKINSSPYGRESTGYDQDPNDTSNKETAFVMRTRTYAHAPVGRSSENTRNKRIRITFRKLRAKGMNVEKAMLETMRKEGVHLAESTMREIVYPLRKGVAGK